MSTMTPKVVMFNMALGEPHKSEVGPDGESTNKLEDMIKELGSKLSVKVLLRVFNVSYVLGALTGVKQEQEYMQVRDRIHRSINENTNLRVVIWSFFEAFILVAMTFGQIYYLKRFFEVRRVVWKSFLLGKNGTVLKNHIIYVVSLYSDI